MHKQVSTTLGSTVRRLPQVVVVILNWNGEKDTLECLDSVFKSDYPSYHVVVVDNGSYDDSVSAIRQTFPAAELVETGENLGYAGGNNIGIRHALAQGCDFIFILNNDTSVDPATLAELVEGAKQCPDAAVLGPVILSADDPDRIWTAGEHFLDERLTCAHMHHGISYQSLDRSEYPTCEWVNGAAFFVSAKALEEIGLFEDRYFLVYEESDWCFRARRAGYSCRIVPEARIWHKVASSFGSEEAPLRTYFSTRNQLLFAERNMPKKVWLMLLWRQIRRYWPKFLMRHSTSRASWPKRLYWGFRDTLSLWRSPSARARRQAIVDYVYRRFGNCPSLIHELNNKWKETRGDLG